MSPNKLRKTSIFLPPNKVHTNILRQYILSCLVALLLYIKVINVINNNNMSSTTPTLIGMGGKTVGTTRFNVSTRTKVLAEVMSVVCKQADHLTLSSADKEKIHTKAVAGLDPKFSILQTYDGEEQLELTHSLSIQFILLEQRLKKFDMIDVFTIQLYSPSDPTDIEAPKQKNLLTHYAKLALADVHKKVCFYCLYTDKSMIWRTCSGPRNCLKSCVNLLYVTKSSKKLMPSQLMKWVGLLSF